MIGVSVEQVLNGDTQAVAMNNSVSIATVDNADIDKAVRRAFELGGGLQVIQYNQRVLIKPNICIPAPSGSGMVTDARVLEAVTRLVLDLGANPVIGEGASAGYDFVGASSTEEAFRISGTEAVAGKLGVPLLNLNNDDSVEVEINDGLVMQRVKIARSAVDCDRIISVPVLKSHHRTLASLNLKNMKGVMSGAEKRKTHRLGLDLGIADLYSAVKPDFCIIDAVTGLQGLWKYPEDSVALNLILAGNNPLAVDAAGIRVMGLEPSEAMHLQYCCRKQGFDAASIELIGQRSETYTRPFLSSSKAFLQRFPGVKLVQGKRACSGCVGQLIGALAYIRDAGLEHTLEGLTLAIGGPFARELPDERIVFAGLCCKEEAGDRGFIPGCPPNEEQLLRRLGGVCGFDAGLVLRRRERERSKLWDQTRHLLNM
jgi:uncharacterized protein (DUF362 family)